MKMKKDEKVTKLVTV